MKNMFWGIIVINTIIPLSGCQKVINVDLNDATPKIVIEGIITDHPGPYSVSITRSGSYFNQPELPPVTGAEVIISDSEGIVDTLTEVREGLYLTSKIMGIPGRTYTLRVYSGGEEYTGISTMQNHVGIDSLTLSISTIQHFDFDGNTNDNVNADLNCYFRDPEQKNFYRIMVFTDDTLRINNFRLYDDQYTNGQIIGLRAAHVSAGHHYDVDLLSLDKATYGYYRTLGDLLHTNPVFGSTPANPLTNLTNGALGYFGACALSSRRIVVNDSMISSLK